MGIAGWTYRLYAKTGVVPASQWTKIVILHNYLQVFVIVQFPNNIDLGIFEQIFNIILPSSLVHLSFPFMLNRLDSILNLWYSRDQNITANSRRSSVSAASAYILSRMVSCEAQTDICRFPRSGRLECPSEPEVIASRVITRNQWYFITSGTQARIYRENSPPEGIEHAHCDHLHRTNYSPARLIIRETLWSGPALNIFSYCVGWQCGACSAQIPIDSSKQLIKL